MVQGAILGLSSIIVRIIGVIYRIPLTNIIGDKGIGYYSVAFDIYQILLLLSSYSLPLAVSKMVSARVARGEYKRVRKIFINALIFAELVGFAAFLITFIFADFFAADVMKVPQSAYALKVLAFALVILSVLGVLRGYFQGLGNMVPTAVSNIAEQILNAVVSVVAASALFRFASDAASGRYDFSNAPEALGAAGGTMGTVAGAFLAMIILTFWVSSYNRKHKYQLAMDTSPEERTGTIIKILVLTIVPVILNTAIYNLSSVVDKYIFSNMMVLRGADADIKDSLIGMYSGKYWLIVNIPIALSNALASSLIPSIVASKARNENQEVIKKINSAVKLTTIVSFPCAAGIGFLGAPIIRLLFPSSENIETLGLMLALGSLTVIFYCLSTITNSILQGIDKMSVPVIHSAISLGINAAVLTALMYFLKMDIFAWVIADILFAIIMCVLNERSLHKYLGYRQDIVNTYAKPAAAAAVMGVAAFFIQKGLDKLIGRRIDVIITIIAAIIIYVILLFVFRIINEEQVSAMPGGRKMVKLFKKLRLM